MAKKCDFGTSFFGVDESSLQKRLIFFNLIAETLEDSVDDEERVEDGPLGLDVLELLCHPFWIESRVFWFKNATESISLEPFHAPLSDLRKSEVTIMT